jgi:hypothetical protein
VATTTHPLTLLRAHLVARLAGTEGHRPTAAGERVEVSPIVPPAHRWLGAGPMIQILTGEESRADDAPDKTEDCEARVAIRILKQVTIGADGTIDGAAIQDDLDAIGLAVRGLMANDPQLRPWDTRTIVPGEDGNEAVVLPSLLKNCRWERADFGVQPGDQESAGKPVAHLTLHYAVAFEIVHPEAATDCTNLESMGTAIHRGDGEIGETNVDIEFPA